MLLNEIAQIMEMARPAKICKKCGKSMAGHHYWYKGGWNCKKSNLEAAKETKKKDKKPTVKAKSEFKEEPTEKEMPASHQDDEKEHKGPVKGFERDADEEQQDPDVKTVERTKEAKKKAKPGETISAAEMHDIDAESEAAAREQINDLFPKASAEQKARAMNIWKARHKEKD